MKLKNLIAAFAIILSFFVGKNWPAVYTWLEGALIQWRRFNVVDIWNQREDWAAHNAFESSLLSVIPPFLVYLMSVVYRRYSHSVLAYFGASSALDTLFRRQDVVHIVSSSISGATFPSSGRHVQTLAMPANATLVPFGDATSIQLISDYFQRTYRGKKTVKVWPSGNFDIPATENLIAIGGPYVNSVTKHYIENIGVENFSIDEDTVAHLGAKLFKTDIDEKRHIINDYGFAFCLHAPDSTKQRVLLLFGLWPPGTRAAAEAAVGMTSASKKRSQFRRYVARERNAVAVLRCGGTGSATFHNAFHDVEEVTLQRASTPE